MSEVADTPRSAGLDDLVDDQLTAADLYREAYGGGIYSEGGSEIDLDAGRFTDDDEEEDRTMADATPAPAARRKKSPPPANGANVGKIKHLKKEDGEPLWRSDIQYDFLKAVFDNDMAVFSNTYEPEQHKQNFADLYIDTMARSSKTSKVLRDKLLSDREAAKGMAMVCLLVNLGRMNTTLNFFPEMRAQLRTYHAIPSLQASQDPHAYKQLQDAPRLKSILKGGMEDREEPNTLQKIKDKDVPRTNPVNLIFVMCNTALKIAEMHFPDHQEFHSLIMKTKYTSKSRATAFLWLMWFYLQSDFTEEGCEENPFGPGVDYGLDVANQGVPKLIKMSHEERALENIDSPEELAFGKEKQQVRAKILEMDQQYMHERENKRGRGRAPFADEGPAILPRIRPSKHESDMDSTRSTPPPRNLGRPSAAGSGRRGAALKYQIFEGSSPAQQGGEGVVARKPRPPTAHQLAVERNRNQRVEYILDRGLRTQHHKSRKLRKKDGAIFRAYKRLQAMGDTFEDSEGEEDTPRNVPVGADKTTEPFREKGLGGLSLLQTEKDDFGEEVSAYAAALRRASRRLDRWRDRADQGVVATGRKKRVAKDEDADVMNGDGDTTMMGGANGDITMDDMEVDDVNQTAMADDEDRGDDDDPDKTEALADSDMD